jgi:hypothetical protein
MNVIERETRSGGFNTVPPLTDYAHAYKGDRKGFIQLKIQAAKPNLPGPSSNLLLSTALPPTHPAIQSIIHKAPFTDEPISKLT